MKQSIDRVKTIEDKHRSFDYGEKGELLRETSLLFDTRMYDEDMYESWEAYVRAYQMGILSYELRRRHWSEHTNSQNMYIDFEYPKVKLESLMSESNRIRMW